MDQIKSIKSFCFLGKIFNIVYHFTGDWMVSCRLMGIKRPNCSYPCLKCLVHKKDLYDSVSVWEKRTLLHQNECLNTKNGNQDYGYFAKSILGDIPFIFDMLHLYLSIGNVLYQYLYFDLASLDGYCGTKKFELEKISQA